jgi:hypothetical protein
MRLPTTNESLVIRTDYSNEAAWTALCEALTAPVDGFQASLVFVSDPAFDGLDIQQVVELLPTGFPQSFVLIVDTQALDDPANAVVVVDLRAECGRTFRVIPSAAWAVENNLSLGNLDFRDFADAADSAGVFRGF